MVYREIFCHFFAESFPGFPAAHPHDAERLPGFRGSFPHHADGLPEIEPINPSLEEKPSK
jgi:hypothetical protein